MKRLGSALLVSACLLASMPAKADVFCNGLGCADFPNIGRVKLYTEGSIMTGLAIVGVTYISFQLLDTYYVHEVLGRERTECDQAMRINCDPATSPKLLFYSQPNPYPHIAN